MKIKNENLQAVNSRRSHRRPNRSGLVILLLLASWLAACTSSSTPTLTPVEGQLSEIVIGLSLPNASEPYYQAIKSGVENMVLRRGGRLISSSADNDPARQETEIQALLVNQIQALLIVPINSERIAFAIQAANRADIPVITLDRTTAGGRVQAHIASDNSSGGRMAARYLAAQLQGQGMVVEIQGSDSVPTTRERAESFSEVLRSFPGIQLVANEHADFSREQARQVFARILSQQSQIDAVFAHNDEMLIGAQIAAKEAGRAEEIVFLGFDGIPDVVTGIENGLYTATIAQQPEEMGRLGAELALKYLQGESIPGLLLVELALLSR